MPEPQKQPQMRIDIGQLLAVFQAKLLEHEAINNALIDLITTWDFRAGNPSRDEIKNLVTKKIEDLTKKATEAVTKSKILVPNKNSNIIT